MTIIISRETRALFPPSVRRKAGLKLGDKLEVQVSGGIITMLPTRPPAVSETPAQRRVVKAELAKARRGPYYGPFKSVGEVAVFLEAYKRGGVRPTKTPR